MRACPSFLQVSDETERHDAMRRECCERRCCNGRKARRESARLAGLLSGSLRKSYLSEMSVSNFFSVGQTKFRRASGMPPQLPRNPSVNREKHSERRERA